MSTPGNDDSAQSAALNLTPEEKRVFSYLFNQADSDQLGVVTGERAVAFFERTKVSPGVLGEIWQIADSENRGLLTQPGFCMVLRLIGHYQAGTQPTAEMAFKSGPIPKFDGLQIPGAPAAAPAAPSPTTGQFPPASLSPQASGQGPIRVPPLDPQKAQQYYGLFERSGAQNGILDGATAKTIFERAGLPNEALGRIWGLSDREQRGALDSTEFIVAMHLLTSMKSRAMTSLPNTLPAGLYEAAARRGAPPPPGSRNSTAIPRQFSGSTGAPVRAQSPLARPPGYASPPPQSAQPTGTSWLVSAQEKAKYDQFFATIDPQGRGMITGEQAVRFFSDSRLSEDTLASIWDLADINGEGQLNRDEFAVAMNLIRQQRSPNPAPLPAFLPTALVPPSMRQQAQQTPAQSTAPAFDNAANTSNMSKSATEDLFGLDQPSSPPRQQVQTTGASSSRDPFASGPASPSSPQRFQPQPQQPNTMFKPFMPTSQFGASLAQQNTGGSATSNQGQQSQARGVQQQQPSGLQQNNVMDDLLGDNDTNVEESSKMTNETTELANMSNQIGNLRSQMEQTQSKKATSQQDLNTTNAQKKDMETRLQQFRGQYEQEVRTVKELDQQLAASRESTKKLGQELAMLEGTYQDLQTQHNTVAQALHADQQENANLKQKISQINAEVSRMKPEIEKMKLDGKKQKGMVSINKKQLATNEGERERLQGEKETLSREAAESPVEESSQHHYGRDAAIGGGVAAAGFGAFEAAKHLGGDDSRVSSPALPTASRLASPAPSTLSSTNPFFRKTSTDGTAEQTTSPAVGGPNPSAFDALFGPSAGSQAGSRTGTPPATSFGRAPPPGGAAGMAGSAQSASSVGEPTPSATPPLSDSAKGPTEPPPPPENRQFMPSHLPLGVDGGREQSPASSTRAIPPASRAGGLETPAEAARSRSTSPAPPMAVPGAFGEQAQDGSNVPGSFDAEQAKVEENVPGAFPSEESAAGPSSGLDFDSAFASVGEGEKSKDGGQDPFAPKVAGNNEFPPIKHLESEDDDSDYDSDSESESGRGFGDNFASPQKDASKDAAPEVGGSELAPESVGATSAERAVPADLPEITSQTSPPTYQESNQPSHGGTGERSDSNSFPAEYGGLLPARDDPTEVTEPTSESTPRAEAVPVAEPTEPTAAETTTTAVAGPSGTQTPTPAVTEQPKNAFDDFDDFDNLSEAKEADKNADDEYNFGQQSTDEFNPAFDSPAASMTNTVASAQQTPVPASRTIQHSDSNGFSGFQPTASTSGAFGGASSVQQTPQSGEHDWDAIFSGLDSSKAPDTSLNGTSDPWGATAAATDGPTLNTAEHAPAAPSAGVTDSLAAKTGPGGRALTPGTEHDDPILKRLTTMGYSREDALGALEKYDYDINRAVDHLTGG